MVERIPGHGPAAAPLPAERDTLLARISGALARRPEVVAAWVHGSFVRDEPFRDIDVAVLLRSEDDAARLEISRRLDDAAVPYDADIRWIQEAPPHFRHRVFSTGRLVVDRDPIARADFVERSLIEYCDTAWMRRAFAEGSLGRDAGS